MNCVDLYKIKKINTFWGGVWRKVSRRRVYHPFSYKREAQTDILPGRISVACSSCPLLAPSQNPLENVRGEGSLAFSSINSKTKSSKQKANGDPNNQNSLQPTFVVTFLDPHQFASLIQCQPLMNIHIWSCINNKIGTYTKNTIIVIVINHTNHNTNLTDKNDLFRYIEGKKYLIPCWFCTFARWQRNDQSIILMVGLFEQWETE